MRGWFVAGVLAVGLFALVAFTVWKDRRRDRRIAETRPPMSKARFVAALVAGGASAAMASALFEWAKGYYHDPLTPYPDDRIYADRSIDPDDVSEFVVDHVPNIRDEVFVNNEDPTLLRLAVIMTGEAAR